MWLWLRPVSVCILNLLVPTRYGAGDVDEKLYLWLVLVVLSYSGFDNGLHSQISVEFQVLFQPSVY